MDKRKELIKWQLGLSVSHGSAYGHKLELVEYSDRWPLKVTQAGSWATSGVPEPVLNSARAMWDARFTEHLLTVYGVQGEIPRLWTGEAGPF